MTTDFIKIATYNTELKDFFFNSELLEPVKNIRTFTKNDPDTSTTKIIKQYKEIYFFFYSKELKISFYPHYHYNNYLHNANDFTVNDAINTTKEFIEIFENDFNIDLNDFRVINIEFGLNIISPIDIKFLIAFLSFHEKNIFVTDIDYPFSKKSFSINKTTNKRNDYKIIKAYAKGIQFPEDCDINTFRFEVKSKESAYIKKSGIKTIYDLLEIAVYNTLEEQIIKEFKEVLILDYNIDTANLNASEQAKVKEFVNPTYWNMIIAENKRNRFRNKVREYYMIIDKIGNHLKIQIEKILIEKLTELKKSAISTPIESVNNYAISTVYNSRNCIQNNQDYNLKDEPLKNNICKITGLDISMQKESILLSHSGLKYYFKNDKKIFEQIRNKYLSKQWSKADFQTQIKEIAHNIRNTISNQNIKQKRIYKPDQLNILNSLGI